MSESLTPTEGARFLLERVSEAGETATYRARIYTPTSTYEATATLSEDGTVALGALGAVGALAGTAATSDSPPASDDLVATLTMLARLTARGAAKKREDGLPPWPARILRWRGPGRGE